jgi:hypothetical protein
MRYHKLPTHTYIHTSQTQNQNQHEQAFTPAVRHIFATKYSVAHKKKYCFEGKYQWQPFIKGVSCTYSIVILLPSLEYIQSYITLYLKLHPTIGAVLS